MNGRSLSMLMLAVVSGLGAMYGTNKLINKPKNDVVVEMQDVVVAARDLKNEEVIKPVPEIVKVVRMPKAAVPAGAFSQAKDLEDRWVQIDILADEPIVDKKLAPRGSPPGLISRIPPGMRAFAVEVSEKTGVSGFILPDHRVDVVQMEPGQRGKTVAETVLQDVLVLASGQVFSTPDDRSIQAKTVTLAVTPEQVDVLVAAQSRGPLSLSLRGLEDHSVFEYKKPEPEPVPVVVAVKEPEPPPPPPPAPVVVLPPPAPPAPPARHLWVYRAGMPPEPVPLHRGADPTRVDQAGPGPQPLPVTVPALAEPVEPEPAGPAEAPANEPTKTPDLTSTAS